MRTYKNKIDFESPTKVGETIAHTHRCINIYIYLYILGEPLTETTCSGQAP